MIRQLVSNRMRLEHHAYPTCDATARHRLSVAVRLALLTTALGGAVMPSYVSAQDAAVVATSVRDYSVTPAPLGDALNQFARQAGITLSATPQQTSSVQSPGLKGRYTVDQALAILLSGTGLQAVSADGSAYVLHRSETEALALPTTDIRGFALGNALGSTEGYNATHSQIATKTSTALLETSQSVSVVTRQQMDDQGSQTVSQAMRYTPGVLTNPYGATHRYDYVAP